MSILRKLKARSRELKDTWRPIGLIFFIITAIESLTNFHARSGPYFWASLALAILATIILYLVDAPARLLLKRLVSLVVDVFLFSLITFGAGSLLFDTFTVRPSALTSMIIVWIWIAAFVVLDWAFAGTPGLRIMGLQLHDTRRQRPSLAGCLARNLLTFVVPLCIAGSIESIVTLSNRLASLEVAIAFAVVSFFPLSIVFSGGQSIPDLLLGMSVRSRRMPESTARIDGRRWLFLALSSLLIGAIVGFAPSTRSLLAEGKQSQFPNVNFEVSGKAESTIAGHLWPRVQAGVPAAEIFLRDVHVYSAAAPLDVGNELDPAAAPCQRSSLTRPIYKVFRMQFAPGIPSIVSNALFANAVWITQRFAVGRPGFIVIEVSNRKSFGVFDTDLSEDYTFCLGGSDSTPHDSLVGSSRHIVVESSFNVFAWLFFGEFGKYAYAEHVPVYSWT